MTVNEGGRPVKPFILDSGRGAILIHPDNLDKLVPKARDDSEVSQRTINGLRIVTNEYMPKDVAIFDGQVVSLKHEPEATPPYPCFFPLDQYGW